MTCQEAVSKGTQILRDAGVDEPDYDARELLCAAAGLTVSEYVLHLKDDLEPEAEETFSGMISRRASHEPLQRIIGCAWFMGDQYGLNEETLIPRFDSETLVLTAAETVERLRDGDKGSGKPAVLDIGTGTGCLLIALMKQCPLVAGTGVDISGRALEAAKRNAEKLNVSAVFRQSDLFANVPESYDIIMSNPPYIPTDVIAGLAEEVREHDPMTALDGGEDGLNLYRRLVAQAPAHLKSGGVLLLEIGYDQGEAVSGLMEKAGFGQIEIRKDLSGHDRVVCGVKDV